jgi:hypothetical protein
VWLAKVSILCHKNIAINNISYLPTFIFRLYEKSIQACLIEGSEERNQWAKGWMTPMTYLKLLPHKAAYAEFVNKQEAQRKTKRE